jgi:hypothetical protein
MRHAASLVIFAVVAASVPAPACFPDNPRARRVSYVVEGATIAAGLVVLALTKAPSQCDRRDVTCMDRAERGEAVGLVLVFGGLIGAVVTAVTAAPAARVAAPGSPIASPAASPQ